MLDCRWKAEALLHTSGSFIGRFQDLRGYINEPFASRIIYPAVMAAWTFIGLVFVWSQLAWGASLVVFALGFGLSFRYNQHLKSEGDAGALNELNQRMLEAEESGNRNALDSVLSPDFTITRASGEKQERKTFLDAVKNNKNPRALGPSERRSLL